MLAFRLARSGLAARDARGLAEAAACPASDFARDAALLALAARTEDLTRERYRRRDRRRRPRRRAHRPRRDPRARARRPRALRPRADRPRRRRARRPARPAGAAAWPAEKGFAPTDALDEVAAATRDALAKGRALDKNALHEELRERVSADLMPWCRGCESHHVAPMLWRYATVRGGRAARRRAPLRPAAGPAGRRPRARPSGASCASTGRHAGRLRRVGRARQAPRAAPVGRGGGRARRGDGRRAHGVAAARRRGRARVAARGRRASACSRPATRTCRSPTGRCSRPTTELRKRLFRPVASPGAVLRDGRLAGLWRAKAKGRRRPRSPSRSSAASRAGTSRRRPSAWRRAARGDRGRGRARLELQLEASSELRQVVSDHRSGRYTASPALNWPPPGGIPERSKGTGCKPVGSAFAGSNPAPTISTAFRAATTRSRSRSVAGGSAPSSGTAIHNRPACRARPASPSLRRLCRSSTWDMSTSGSRSLTERPSGSFARASGRRAVAAAAAR